VAINLWIMTNRVFFLVCVAVPFIILLSFPIFNFLLIHLLQF